MKKIDLIFTRDFSLCVSDFWHVLLSEEVKKVFGRGIDSQIMRFNGRALEAYRVADEMVSLKNHIINKSPEDKIFLSHTEKQFKQDIKQTRSLMKQLGTAGLDGLLKYFSKSVVLFKKIYPFIMFSNFLPAAWKKKFLEVHPNTDEIINRWYQARIYSEGTFEIIDAYWRELIGNLLVKNNINNKYDHVVRFKELEDLISGGQPPKESVLQKRLAGYIIYQGKLFVGKSFPEFIKEKNFDYQEFSDKDVVQFKGQVASQGSIIKGSVQVILNNKEVKDFKVGNILVTTMTTPDFISAMKKSVAIVTDEGGITCHAAIVSRELGIPCVIGTKIATKVLKDGDNVEVDATHGIIRKI